MGKIVVGVDCAGPLGDTSDLVTRSHGLVRAVAQARSHGSHLEVISVWTYPPLTLEEKLRVSAGLMEAEANEAVNAAVTAVLGETSEDIDLSVSVVQGAPARVLVEASRDADLLVVGRHDHAKLRHFVLGSIASQCVRHASCPTMVVPKPDETRVDTGRIVVGVDGSENSAAALRWALREAAVVGADVHLVTTWLEPISAAGELADPVLLMEMVESSANKVVEEMTSNAVVPDGVVLTGLAGRGDPAATLVHESESADLVVVGSRGRGGFAGLLLGSVSRNTLHRASCPVVVIPQSADVPSLDSDVTE